MKAASVWMEVRRLWMDRLDFLRSWRICEKLWFAEGEKRRDDRGGGWAIFEGYYLMRLRLVQCSL